MLFSSFPIDIVHHIVSYTGVLKLRNGKYMGQILPTDTRYELLRNIPKIVLRQCGEPFGQFGHMMYIFRVTMTNTNHYLELVVNNSKSRCFRVTVVYYNKLHIGRTLRYYRG